MSSHTTSPLGDGAVGPVDWSLSRLVRPGGGAATLGTLEVRQRLAHYDVTGADLLDARTGRLRSPGRYPWSDLRAYYSPAELLFLGCESVATTIRNFEPVLVPGLLQTRAYARAIMADVYGEHWDVFDRRWEARSRRQRLHQRPQPPAMAFVVDEAVVRRVVGSPAIMRGQLEQLVTWGALPHVDLRVLPFSAGAHHGMPGPFIVLGFARDDDPDLLFREGVDRSSTSTEDPVVTRSYATRFGMLQAQALDPDATTGFLRDALASLS
ncbi:MAG TPA: DUF5753 domain-containing protein [Acidimicrobiales bacterium]